MVVRQIVNINNGTLLDPFSQKLILLFGDLAQLPPVCHHQEPLCHVCNIQNSAYIAAATTHNMTFSVRHAADPAYVQFLDTICVKQPTKQQIAETLSQCVINETELLRVIDDATTLICTHREDVYKYNNLILQNSFSASDIVAIPLKTNALDEPLLQEWLQDKAFHEMDNTAIGARCMITENINLAMGAANESTCHTLSYSYDCTGQIAAIEISFIASNNLQHLLMDTDQKTQPSYFSFSIIQIFDKFFNMAATSKPKNNYSVYPSSNQIRLANMAGEAPSAFIEGFRTTQLLHSYINKCSNRNKEYRNNELKLATGLQKEILLSLGIDFDESNKLLLDTEAQEILNTKTAGITTYAIEMLHYGYRISLAKLVVLDKNTASQALSNMVKEFGNEFKGNERAILTDEKFTWHFNRHLFDARFGETIDPFLKLEPLHVQDIDNETNKEIPNNITTSQEEATRFNAAPTAKRQRQTKRTT
ncbi:hypothetical protein GOP47_0031062 [Adiantum capillus-veneris]|nr:hypothetical protein GOP47_0031062 [Adiantum capillus-veneris]